MAENASRIAMRYQENYSLMTSQKGAPACWGSNEALPRAPSPSMTPADQPLHAILAGRPGPAHWLRGWERQRSSSTTCACSATSLGPQHGVIVMETWRQCIRSIATVGHLDWLPYKTPGISNQALVFVRNVKTSASQKNILAFWQHPCQKWFNPSIFALWNVLKNLLEYNLG